jgi:hypothetical protein
MTIDDVLLVIIFGGLGLSVVYLRAEYVLYRGFKAAQRKTAIVRVPARRTQPRERPRYIGSLHDFGRHVGDS